MNSKSLVERIKFLFKPDREIITSDKNTILLLEKPRFSRTYMTYFFHKFKNYSNKYKEVYK